MQTVGSLVVAGRLPSREPARLVLLTSLLLMVGLQTRSLTLAWVSIPGGLTLLALEKTLLLSLVAVSLTSVTRMMTRWSMTLTMVAGTPQLLAVMLRLAMVSLLASWVMTVPWCMET